MRLLAKCRNEGINLTLNQVLRAKSFLHLAAIMEVATATRYEKEQTGQAFDLSPVQRLYFKSANIDASPHFNQSSIIRVSRKIEPTAMKRALDSIVACHSMLRARFSRNDVNVWQQSISCNAANAYAFAVHDATTTAGIATTIATTQKNLDIFKGPIFAVNLFHIHSGEQIIFLVAHHLVVDVVSWSIILDDLEHLLLSSTEASLQRPLSFQTWCEKQAMRASDPYQQNIMRKQSLTVYPADFAFWGMDKRPNVYGDVEKDAFALDKAFSALALGNHKALRTDVVDLLLASILRSFSRVFINRKPPTIFNESHGREAWESSKIDPSRTVGWFTAMYPITVLISEEEDKVVHTVRQVKDARRKIIDNGRPYFAHRFMTDDGRQRYTDHQPIEILFNYTGNQRHGSGNSLFTPIQLNEEDEETTADVGASTTRMALFEISASVSEGQLCMSFMYNRKMKNIKGIRRWISECERTLREIVTDLERITTPEPTLADFPLLSLESYSRLDRVLKTLLSTGVASFDSVEDIFPCSSVQVGMILSQIKDPKAYWSSTIFEVKSKKAPVDTNKVSEAWRKVVHRHPALRTVFVDSVCKGGTFDQVVVKNCDAGSVSYTCSDIEWKSLLTSAEYSELNGKKNPALPHQAIIAQTTSGRIFVRIIVNHAVIDGGSLGILGKDLQDAYEGNLTDDEGPLYSTYIKYLQDLPVDEAIKYWKEKLLGVKPCYFPTTFPSANKLRQLRSLDMRFDCFADLHTLADTSNVTFANILLASWALVLRSSTNSSDVCYGYLTSGRNVPVDNIEMAVGAFINMLVSRVQIDLAASLLEVIYKVQNNFMEAMPHQHCSLAQFQHDLGLSGNALFNTAVSLQNCGASDKSTGLETGIEFEQVDGHDPSEFAITVNIDATRNDEAVRFTYWSDAVTDGEAKNVSTLMAKILTQTLTNANQTVADLDSNLRGKTLSKNEPHLMLPKPRPSILRSRSSASQSSTFSTTSPPRTPRIAFPDLTPTPSMPSTASETPDWNSLIRSIISEMVPQIVDQIVARSNMGLDTASATVDHTVNHTTGLVAGRTSQSQRGRPNLVTAPLQTTSGRASSVRPGSARSRRLSTTSDAESRIQTAADMVAAVGLLATEASNGVAPDYVEKKLLALWSELLEMVEDNIDQDDSFFVGLKNGQHKLGSLTSRSN